MSRGRWNPGRLLWSEGVFLCLLAVAGCACHRGGPRQERQPDLLQPRGAVRAIRHPDGWLERRWVHRGVPVRLLDEHTSVFFQWAGAREQPLRRLGGCVWVGRRLILTCPGEGPGQGEGRSRGGICASCGQRSPWIQVTPALLSRRRFWRRVERRGLRLVIACPIDRPCSLAGLAHHPVQVVGLSIKDAALDQEGLTRIRALRGLRELSLRGTALPQGAGAVLAHLSRLEALDLSGTGLQDRDAESVATLTRLRWLDLGYTIVSSAGLLALAGLRGRGGLRRLVHLGLSHTRVGDQGLRALSSFPRLETLDLSGTRVTDAGLDALVTRQSLRSLDLRQASVTDLGAPLLGTLVDLRVLLLPRHVSEVGVHALDGLSRLELLGAPGVARARGSSARGRPSPSLSRRTGLLERWIRRSAVVSSER